MTRVSTLNELRMMGCKDGPCLVSGPLAGLPNCVSTSRGIYGDAFLLLPYFRGKVDYAVACIATLERSSILLP